MGFKAWGENRIVLIICYFNIFERSHVFMDRKEFNFYIASDMMMNRGKFSYSLIEKVHCFFRRDLIMDYLKAMRYKQYYRNRAGGGTGVTSIVSLV